MPDGFVPSWSYLCLGERTRPENQRMDRGRYKKENGSGIFGNKRESNENMKKIPRDHKGLYLAPKNNHGVQQTIIKEEKPYEDHKYKGKVEISS